MTDPGAATVVVATAEKHEDPLLTQLRQDLAGEYDVEKELGRGGMAVVYRATEIELHRTVALKVLPPGMGGGTMAERFKREARMAAALDHQNIIPVYRVGQAAGTYFFAMKFVEGRAVDAIIEQQGALPVPVVLAILRGSTSALAFGHQRGIVHRDIKGANILIDRDGRVLVSDFGIARATEEKTLTASGSVMGTPHFMSPEQCSGAKVGPQSDQYSLGVLAFQMLTGSVPFDADSLMPILQHHFFTPPPDIREVRPGVPEPLLGVVYQALAKDAAQRWASTRDMLTAIEAIPFPDAERREADEMLRKLAVGTPIPEVRTGSLPPLADTRVAGLSAPTSGPTVTAAKAAPPRPAPKPKSKVPVVVGVLVAMGVLGGGGTLLVVQRQQAARAVAQAAADSAHRADSLRLDSIRLAAQRPPAPAAESTAVAPADTTPRPGRQPPARVARPERAAAQRPAAPAQTEPQVVPAPPAPTPQPAAPAATGFIRLRTVPSDATIFVDGRQLGSGSLYDFTLPAGTRRIRITSPGCETMEFLVTIEAGGTANLRTRTLTCQ
ncbi:MAG: serine/threonine protein kinase [Gemmatimonadetes bacterium]|nr:serine/threonine protein kinase [Gemmatimonadota bacterium]